MPESRLPCEGNTSPASPEFSLVAASDKRAITTRFPVPDALAGSAWRGSARLGMYRGYTTLGPAAALCLTLAVCWRVSRHSTRRDVMPPLYRSTSRAGCTALLVRSGALRLLRCVAVCYDGANGVSRLPRQAVTLASVSYLLAVDRRTFAARASHWARSFAMNLDALQSA